MTMLGSFHPDTALVEAVAAAAKQWNEHPPEFYAATWAAWSAKYPAHAQTLSDVDARLRLLPRVVSPPSVRRAVEDTSIPGVHVLLLLRQQEASALALAWVRFEKAHGRTWVERSTALAAMSSWVVFAARAGAKGCRFTGPVTTPLIRETRPRRWRSR